MRVSVFIALGWLLAACAGRPTESVNELDAANDELRHACATVLQDCRGAHSVRLLKEDGSVHEITFEIDVPVVQGHDFVTIYPGETVFLEAEIQDDEVVLLRAVPEIVNPDKTITFAFSQSEDRPDMLLVARNPFPRHLKYRLGMQILERDGLLATSSCPVFPGGSVYESWPHPIFVLVLTDFKLLPEETTRIVCE